jgi:hypothetical protein
MIYKVEGAASIYASEPSWETLFLCFTFRLGDMETDSSKCVIVVDTGLPMGLKVNTAGLLGATLGRRVESIIGPDAIDGSGESHTGILNIPLPILATDAETIKGIREKALKLGVAGRRFHGDSSERTLLRRLHR